MKDFPPDHCGVEGVAVQAPLDGDALRQGGGDHRPQVDAPGPLMDQPRLYAALEDPLQCLDGQARHLADGAQAVALQGGGLCQPDAVQVLDRQWVEEGPHRLMVVGDHADATTAGVGGRHRGHRPARADAHLQWEAKGAKGSCADPQGQLVGRAVPSLGYRNRAYGVIAC
ncbi:hypothetical protein [Actinacidiphila sp. bgisy160]|uniref:hypothetical protein n=1 Tax=Actinacidiphila sp. bgisy160 TaxID=3413796 RepID=UPI003D7537F2